MPTAIRGPFGAIPGAGPEAIAGPGVVGGAVKVGRAGVGATGRFIGRLFGRGRGKTARAPRAAGAADDALRTRVGRGGAGKKAAPTGRFGTAFAKGGLKVGVGGAAAGAGLGAGAFLLGKGAGAGIEAFGGGVGKGVEEAVDPIVPDNPALAAGVGALVIVAVVAILAILLFGGASSAKRRRPRRSKA